MAQGYFQPTGAAVPGRAAFQTPYCVELPPSDEPVPDLSLVPAPGAPGPLPPLSRMQRSSSVPISPTHSVGVAPGTVLPPAAASPDGVVADGLVVDGLVADGLLPDGLLEAGALGGLLSEVLPPPAAAPAELPLLLGLAPLLELSLLLAPALPPDAPPAPPALPCAHEAVANPTRAAVTAALIIFCIMMEMSSSLGW